jgi:hypothetical protein
MWGPPGFMGVEELRANALHARIGGVHILRSNMDWRHACLEAVRPACTRCSPRLDTPLYQDPLATPEHGTFQNFRNTAAPTCTTGAARSCPARSTAHAHVRVATPCCCCWPPSPWPSPPPRRPPGPAPAACAAAAALPAAGNVGGVGQSSSISSISPVTVKNCPGCPKPPSAQPAAAAATPPLLPFDGSVNPPLGPACCCCSRCCCSRCSEQP